MIQAVVAVIIITLLTVNKRITNWRVDLPHKYTNR